MTREERRVQGMAAAAGVERELALVIISDHPGDIAHRIAGERQAAGYFLIPRGVEVIRDIHLDTPDGQLDARHLALRVRAVSGETQLTLKGPSTASGGGSQERSEIERSWSGEGVAASLGALASFGVRLPQPVDGETGRDPIGVMRSLGFVVIQDRKTRRTVRDVAAVEDGPVLAELAIDAVVYRLRGLDVRHFEVEIEARSDLGDRVMRLVSRDLAARYAPALKQRLGGKLAIGLALDRLHRAGSLEALLGATGVLTPAAYDTIDVLEGVNSPEG